MPDTGIFPNIEVQRMATELHLEGEGSNRGKRDFPETSAASLDLVEKRIIERVIEHRCQGLDTFHEHRTVYEERITRDIHADFQNDVNTAQTNFQTAIAIWRNELSSSRDYLKTVSKELDDFRRDNQITRANHEGYGVLQWFVWFLFFLIFESVLNGVFFAESHVMGIAGGVGIAFGISFINVGFASVFGYGVRYFNHVLLWKKVVGTAIFVIAVVLTALFNFFVAHFRDAMTQEGATWDQAAGRAIDHITAGNFFPESIEAWLLALLGLLMAGLAGWKAYSADDPYPGYGRVWRKKHEAEHYYNTVPAEVTKKRDEALQKLADAHESVEDKIEDVRRASIEWDLLHNQFGVFLEQCNQKVNLLLKTYREANTQERQTPAPKYFSEDYTFPPVTNSGTKPAPTPQKQLTILIREAKERIHADYTNIMYTFNGNSDTNWRNKPDS